MKGLSYHGQKIEIFTHGSILLSFDRLVVKGSGQFHDLDKIKKIYRSSGVPLAGEQISFCHTGHRTSLSWFVSHELLGNKDARMNLFRKIPGAFEDSLTAFKDPLTAREKL